MLSLKRRRENPDLRGSSSRRGRAIVVSVVLHIALAVGLWNVLQFPRSIAFWFDEPSADTTPPQRITYVIVAPTPLAAVPAPTRPAAPPAGPVRRGRVEPSPTATAPPLVAPTVVPSELPPVARTDSGPVRGPLASGRGAVQGVQPGYSEPRIWVEPQVVIAPALTGDAKLDSAINARVMAYRDSMATYAVEPNKFERGDWTVERDGKKYGIDRQFIRLGKFSIPTALLGLLPMNQQGNPIAYEREKRLATMRAEILEQAAQAMNEEEFRRAVKAIRDRKEKERRELEKKKKEVPKVVSEY